MDAWPNHTQLVEPLGINPRKVARGVAQTFQKLFSEEDDSRIASIFRETESDLQYLGLALEQNDWEGFRQYLGWAGRVRTARGLGKKHLVAQWEILERVLVKNLEPPLADEIGGQFGSALEEFRNTPESVPVPLSLAGKTRIIGNLLLNALLNGNRSAAKRIVHQAFRQGLEAKDLYLKVLQPILHEVGRLWEGNKITAAQEHLATAVAENVMGHLYEQLAKNPPPKKSGTVALAGVAGELHSIGLRMVADFLEAAGWRVLSFGVNLPIESLVPTLKSSPPDLLALSVTLPINLPQARNLILTVRNTRDLERCKIIVGGGAVCTSEKNRAYLEADAIAADAEETVKTVSRLAG